MKISEDLYLKILCDLEIDTTTSWKGYTGGFSAEIKLSGSLLDEAINWFKSTRRMVISGIDYQKYKVNVGRYIGIFPCEIKNDTILFAVDTFKDESWEDWFVNETEN